MGDVLRRAATLVAAAALVLTVQSLAHADDEVVIKDEETTSPSPAPSGPGGTDVATGPVRWTENRYVVACLVNGPDNPGDVLCMSAVSTCPGEREIRYRLYQRPMLDNRPQGGWEYVGTVCRGPEETEPFDAPEVTPEIVVDQAAARAPESRVHVEPATRSYVRVPNNFWTDERGGTAVVVLFEGLPFEKRIPVEFVPVSYRWEFGDGGSSQGAGIQGAEPGQAGAVEYAYRAQGDYEVTLTREFEARFTIPGRGPQVEGGISTTSPPHVLRIGEIQTTVNEVG